MPLIEIGSQKQLFVDDYLIESMADTRQVSNPGQKVENNPVLRPEPPWEGNYLALSEIVFDERDQVFRMWYQGKAFRARQGANEIVVEGEDEGVTCLATSEDGINWERPDLGLVEFEGSKHNNILPEDQVMEYFFQDLREDDPARRYKGLIRKGSTQTPGMTFDLYYSPNGFQWTPYEDNPVIDTSPRIGRWGPTVFMGWDEIRQVYAVHMENCLHRRCPLGKRVIGRAESPDMVHWSDPETILVPDEDEGDRPDTEFYAMPCIIYEGMYVGMLWHFRTTNTTHHPQAIFSRDGIHYNRQFQDPFIARGAPADFDSTVVTVRQPVLRDGQVYTPYQGRNWRSPETLLELGDRAIGAVGLAMTDKDGFVSLDGTKGVTPGMALGPERGAEDLYMTRLPGVSDEVWRSSFSQMVTRSFGFTGTQLHLNLRSALEQWGAGPCEVRVEVLTPNHEYIPGLEFKDSDPITTSGEDHVAAWNGNSDLSRLGGGPIKLRFYFKNAKLYSFQTSE